MVQLADEHFASGLLLFVLALIHKREEMLDHSTALISHWTGENDCPKLAAILAAVTYFRLGGRATTFEHRFKGRQRDRIGSARHQRVEALAEHLLPVVTR